MRADPTGKLIGMELVRRDDEERVAAALREPGLPPRGPDVGRSARRGSPAPAAGRGRPFHGLLHHGRRDVLDPGPPPFLDGDLGRGARDAGPRARHPRPGRSGSGAAPKAIGSRAARPCSRGRRRRSRPLRAWPDCRPWSRRKGARSCPDRAARGQRHAPAARRGGPHPDADRRPRRAAGGPRGADLRPRARRPGRGGGRGPAPGWIARSSTRTAGCSSARSRS